MKANILFISIIVILVFIIFYIFITNEAYQIEKEKEKESVLFYECIREEGFGNTKICQKQYPNVPFPPPSTPFNKDNILFKFIDDVNKVFENR